jgi:hypothetical protein
MGYQQDPAGVAAAGAGWKCARERL